MKQKFFKTALIVMSTLVSFAFAQQAPAPNPMDDIPEAMPFDIPYGNSITLEKADQLMSAALTEAKKRNWKMI